MWQESKEGIPTWPTCSTQNTQNTQTTRNSRWVSFIIFSMASYSLDHHCGMCGSEVPASAIVSDGWRVYGKRVSMSGCDPASNKYQSNKLEYKTYHIDR